MLLPFYGQDQEQHVDRLNERRHASWQPRHRDQRHDKREDGREEVAMTEDVERQDAPVVDRPGVDVTRVVQLWIINNN